MILHPNEFAAQTLKQIQPSVELGSPWTLPRKQGMPYVVKLSMTGLPEQGEALCEVLYAKLSKAV